mmetsp:Transcript_88656/g.251341  ORF Transcript_88656/g.251341 Transcript_88656/m.251341 type:complete len:312 (+) Transcript_88656:1415-2350(+)
MRDTGSPKCPCFPPFFLRLFEDGLRIAHGLHRLLGAGAVEELREDVRVRRDALALLVVQLREDAFGLSGRRERLLHAAGVEHQGGLHQQRGGEVPRAPELLKQLHLLVLAAKRLLDLVPLEVHASQRTLGRGHAGFVPDLPELGQAVLRQVVGGGGVTLLEERADGGPKRRPLALGVADLAAQRQGLLRHFRCPAGLLPLEQRDHSQLQGRSLHLFVAAQVEEFRSRLRCLLAIHKGAALDVHGRRGQPCLGLAHLVLGSLRKRQGLLGLLQNLVDGVILLHLRINHRQQRRCFHLFVPHSTEEACCLCQR